MQNDIEITVENIQGRPLGDDDDWDPMREEYENIQLNSYDHGPGASLDASMQRPAYRNANNQVVYKIMVNCIPAGLSRTGLQNILMNFGTPNISKCQESYNHVMWALVEFKTLQEAERTILALDSNPPYNMRVSFARSDEENERIRREKEEEEQMYFQVSRATMYNQPIQTVDQRLFIPNRCLRMFGRGHRGRIIINTYRQNCEKRSGLKDCVWSNGIPDFRDPGGLTYEPKSNRHEASNRYMQIVVTTGGNSVRRVTMGRGYVPPEGQEGDKSAQQQQQKSFGSDVCVPLLPCKKCGTNTIQKCSQCGTPYCSRKCQKEDYIRHKPECNVKECIDFVGDTNSDHSLRYVPLARPIENVQPAHSTTPVGWTNTSWKRQSVVGILGEGTNAIVTITSEESGKLHGVLSCPEIFEVSEKLFSLASTLEQRSLGSSFWPPPETSVAVNFEGTVWRGYILNTPLIGDSTIFTVALCDLAKIEKINITDIYPLSSEYFNLPEMAVTCDVLQSKPELGDAVAKDGSVNLKIQNPLNSKVSAQVVSNGGEVIGLVTISQWEPFAQRVLTPVQLTPSCQVVLSAYHNQHALYVRPVGRQYQEQMFNLLQKVAAVMITAPPLNRAPIKDEMVACKFKHDGNYYRAIVHDAISDKEYSVFFVDFGNVASARLEEMKALPWDLKKSPCMAVKVGLKGVAHGPLSEGATHYLNMVVQKEQQLRLEFSNQTAEGVELFLPDNRSFNAKVQELLLPDWKHSMNNGDEPHGGEVFLLENFKVLPLIKGELKSGFTNVIVTNVMVDGRIAVCPVDRPEIEHVLETLNFQINEYCESTDTNISYNPRENEVCLAKFNDGMWYRAVNSKTKTDTQSCQVIFLDFGNVEDIQFKNIRRMVPDFVSSPTIVSMCHLDGVPDVLTTEMIKRISQVVTANKLYEVQVLDLVGFGEYKIVIPEISNQLKSEFSSN